MSRLYHAGPVSDHFDGQRFHNLYAPTIDRSLLELRRWKSQARGLRWPPPGRAGPTDRPPARVEALRIAMVGHASLLIQVPGCNILVDPVWSGRASPFSFIGPRRHTPPGIAFADLPPIDVVLITHSHYDHLDIPTLRQLQARDQPRVIAPLGVDVVLRGTVPNAAIRTGDWWDEVPLAPGLQAAICPANHWSSRTPWDRRRSLWCGYVLRLPGGDVYLAGDTAWGDGSLFAALRQRYGMPRLAILPIGAYEPRWFMANQHMNPAEAVQAFQELGAAEALGVHWGTFRLTDEPQDEPPRALAAALLESGIAPARFKEFATAGVWQAA